MEDLNKIPWSVLDTFNDDLEEMLATWISLFLEAVDRHVPVKHLRVKSLEKPIWLTDEILHQIRERDDLKKKMC